MDTDEKKEKQKLIREKLIGTAKEPTWDSEKECTVSDLLLAIRWYNDNKDDKFAAKILKCEVSKARRFTSLAWSIRMVDRGFKLPAGNLATIERMKKEFSEFDKQTISDAMSEADTGATPAVSSVKEKIEEGVQNKLDFFIGELEGMVDEFVRGGKPSPYEFMTNNGVKSVHSKEIVEHFKAKAKELLIAESGKDKQLEEGYSNFSKGQLRALIAFVVLIIKDAEKIASNQKVSRVAKPRKKKAISVDKVVAKVNYKVEDPAFKIKSVSPTNILGAEQVWVFNTKNKKLGVYKAKDGAGIGIKGSTLQNFSDESISKTLRKPEKILEKVVSGGKLILRKVMDESTSKPSLLTGRLNSDTVILRVVK